MQRAVKIVTVLLLVLTMGLHWTLLQTVAWTGMIVSYAQDNPLGAAISMTFDGEHPCCLCKTIKQGRAEEKQQEKTTPVDKLPIAIIWHAPAFCFYSQRETMVSPTLTATPRVEAPPKPRPKTLQSSPLA